MAVRKKEKDIKNTGIAKRKERYQKRRHTATQIKRCNIKNDIEKTDN